MKKFSLVVCLAFVFFLPKCRDDSREAKHPPESPDPVILSFEVYNHTQGHLMNFERSAKRGARVTIILSELDVEGVDENRMVIREGRTGTRIAFSQSGVVSFEAPKKNKIYTLYLMNALNGTDYRKVDTWINTNEGVLEYDRFLAWYREDKNSYQGPDDVIQEAIDQLNDALDYPWGRYGCLQKIDQRENSSFGVGYGYCRNQYGWHSPYWAGVNPDYCLTHKTKLETFIEEIFELITRLNDIGGKDTATLITDPDSGELNAVGKDLLAYVFVKDEKSIK